MINLELLNPSTGIETNCGRFTILDVYEVCGSTYALLACHNFMVREIIVDNNIMYVAPKESLMAKHILALYKQDALDYYVYGKSFELLKLPRCYKKNTGGKPIDFERRNDLICNGGFNATFLGLTLNEKEFAEKRFAKFKAGAHSEEMKAILASHSDRFTLKKEISKK